MLSNFLEETQTPAYSLTLISDSANARNTARRDACYNSAIWENVPIKATNSFVAAQKATSHRGRRGDSALTLRQLTNFEDFFELGEDLGLTGAWAEIGVCQGDTSRKILERGPQSQLLLVDAWDAVDIYTAEEGARNLEITIENLAHIAPERYTMLRMSTSQAVSQVADASLDFIYLDAGHMYADAKQDINAWWPKLKPGGIFAGDDYYNGFVLDAGYTFGVRDAVEEFFGNINHRVYATDAEGSEEAFQQWYVLKCA
mmetsp:Transcript_18159/g.33756  ORF Transcript_18159/g.33756 Transcript_18159/m.33756 type:complete len:258 (-) Transcript_18159:31-804(-)